MRRKSPKPLSNPSTSRSSDEANAMLPQIARLSTTLQQEAAGEAVVEGEVAEADVVDLTRV